MAAKKNALGRGLSALMEDDRQEDKPGRPGHNEIDIELVDVNPYQPRTRFEEEALNELAESIKKLGVIQPVIVRQNSNGRYQLIAGERRLRASIINGMKTVPAFVREADDQALLEMALVENIQREDLDAIEVAISFQRLIDECNLTQESLSERVGKKRSTVSNYIRLLRLPAEIQLGLKHKQINMGHARAIIGIDDDTYQLELYNKIIEQNLSVREVEELVKKFGSAAAKSKESELPGSLEVSEYDRLKEQLANFFGTSVEFKRSEKGKGKIIIPFASNDELERILELLDKIDT